MLHCEDKMAAAKGPEQCALQQHSGYLSECCPHDTVPLRCHFMSVTALHGPVVKKHTTCLCFVSVIFLSFMY